MADKVPYTGVPDAQYSDRPTPEMHVDAPAAAFGTNVAAAVEGMGNVVEGAGKEIFARALAFQDLTNHATARGAAVKTAQEQASLLSEFDTKEGLDAGPEALTDLQKKLDDVRVKNGTGLNPTAAELYQTDAATLQNRLYVNSAGHSAQAVKQYDLDTIKAKRDTDNTLVSGPLGQDPSNVEKAYAGNHSAAVLEGHHAGAAPDSDIVKDKLNQYNSETSLKAIQGFVDRHDPEGAQKFFNDAQKKGRISGQWSDEAEKLIENSQVSYQAKDIANKTYDPKKSEAENIKAAQDAADKASKGDARVTDATIAQVRTKYAIDTSVNKQALDEATSTIDKALLDMRGKSPRTLDDLMQDSKFKDAFGVIQSNEERAGQTLIQLNDRLAQTVRNDNNVNPERSTATQRLLGEAHESPEQFVKEDLWKLNLSMDQRKELLKLQEGIRTSGNSGFRDRATEQTMSDMRQQIKDGIGERGTPEYNEFRGALQQEFDFAREQGKVIDPKMATDMATKLLQSKVISKGYIWNTQGHAYQPSEDEAKAIRSQLGSTLTDDQVQRIYLKKLNDVLINKGATNGQ